jgi:hypothetical protein
MDASLSCGVSTSVTPAPDKSCRSMLPAFSGVFTVARMHAESAIW